jgi:hypothetical protein
MTNIYLFILKDLKSLRQDFIKGRFPAMLNLRCLLDMLHALSLPPRIIPWDEFFHLY